MAAHVQGVQVLDRWHQRLVRRANEQADRQNKYPVKIALPVAWFENSNWRYPSSAPSVPAATRSSQHNQLDHRISSGELARNLVEPVAIEALTSTRSGHGQHHNHSGVISSLATNTYSVLERQLAVEAQQQAIGTQQLDHLRLSGGSALATMATSAADNDPLFSVYGISFTGDSLACALIILLVTFLLISTSIMTIAVVLTTEALREVTGFFIISLSISDLLSGTLITPFSLYAAIDPNWRFGNMPESIEDDYGTSNVVEDSHLSNGMPVGAYGAGHEDNGSMLCRVESYLEVMVWTSIVYTFMWMCVDRYTALEHPSRYEVEMSATRVKCWIAFSWISAVLLGCPILAAQMKAVYFERAYICQLDWTATTSHFSWTMAALVLLPTATSVIYTYRHIFAAMREPDELEDTQKMLLDTDPNFMVTFFVILAFVLSWLPYFLLKGQSVASGALFAGPLHFSLAWLAMSAGCWKFVICFILHPDFRAGFCNFCHVLCCCCCCCCPTHPPTQQHQQLQQQQQQQQQQQYQQQLSPVPPQHRLSGSMGNTQLANATTTMSLNNSNNNNNNNQLNNNIAGLGANHTMANMNSHHSNRHSSHATTTTTTSIGIADGPNQQQPIGAPTQVTLMKHHLSGAPGPPTQAHLATMALPQQGSMMPQQNDPMMNSYQTQQQPRYL